MHTDVLLEFRNEVAWVTFSPEISGKPPTLDHQVLDELYHHIQTIKQNSSDLRAVVVRSNSPRYFLVGANINALKTLDEQTIVHWIQHGHQVFNELSGLPLPVIACIEGFALGGGLELALACDIILATESARLGQPEASLGFVAGWGGSFRLPQRIGAGRAKILFFTGTIIDARKAYEYGLVDDLVLDGNMENSLDTLLQNTRQVSLHAVRLLKHLVDQNTDSSLSKNLVEETSASVECIASKDTRDRIERFLKNRQK